MDLFAGLLLISSLLCALVTGFVFTYAVIVMPGLAKLGDREFIRAFQVTDGIIQDKQPVFMLVWFGSIISVIGTMLAALMADAGGVKWLAIATGAAYLLGVQGLTIFVHLPLNTQIQNVGTDEMDAKSLHEQRVLFEARWTHFNRIRTVIACVVSASFMAILSLS
jgi:uncharacterized membrane protein